MRRMVGMSCGCGRNRGEWWRGRKRFGELWVGKRGRLVFGNRGIWRRVVGMRWGLGVRRGGLWGVSVGGRGLVLRGFWSSGGMGSWWFRVGGRGGVLV